jgi:hypothetical protein
MWSVFAFVFPEQSESVGLNCNFGIEQLSGDLL